MHLQRQADEHSGSGNRGASSDRKRLGPSVLTAGHAPGPSTTLTACHGPFGGARTIPADFVEIGVFLRRNIGRVLNRYEAAFQILHTVSRFPRSLTVDTAPRKSFDSSANG